MEKKYGEFVFKKKDLEIESNDGIRHFVNPEKDVRLYKIPYRPDGEGEEFYMHETENHGIQFYRLYFVEDWAKFESVEKEYIANVLIDEELKHDTIITREQLELLETNGIKLAQYSI
ncbi:MAG: hypothetical protein WA364_20455 [Candidatus Nitrosopolaris sp.]